MPLLVAILCALAIVATQILYGGAMRPVFALPGYAICGLAGILGLVEVIRTRRVSPKLGYVLLVAAFAGWLIWRCLSATDVWLGETYLREVLACLVVYLLFGYVVVTPRARLVFLAILMVFAFVQVVYAALQFGKPTPGTPIPWLSEQLRAWYGFKITNKGHGFYLNGNHLAWFLNMLAMFGLAMGCWGRLKLGWRILWGYAGVVCLAGVGLTLSRGGYLGMAAGVAAFAFLSVGVFLVGLSGRRLKAAVAILTGLVVAGLSVWFLYSQSFRIQDRVTILSEDVFRAHMLEAASRQTQLNPLTGSGPGMFQFFGRQYREVPSFTDDVYVHNDWAQIGSDFGLVALILVIAIVLWHGVGSIGSLRGILRRRMHSSSRAQSQTVALLIGGVATLAAYITHSFFDFNMQIPSNALLAAACLGMLANPESEHSSSRSKRFDLPSRILGGLLLISAAVAVLLSSWKASGPELAWLRAENDLLLGNAERAQLKAESGLELDPNHSRLQRTMGEAIVMQIRTAEGFEDRLQKARAAAQVFAAAVENAPQDGMNHLLLGETLLRNGRVREAQQEALEAIRLSPTLSSGYQLYGRVLETQGRYEESLRVYQVGATLPGKPGIQEDIRRLQERIQKRNTP